MYLGQYNENKMKYKGLDKPKKRLDLGTNPCIRKIGQFNIKTRGIIGASEWMPINLSPGTYAGYSVDDNLMIIRQDLGIDPVDAENQRERIGSWDWVYSGKSLNHSDGSYTFGFYDMDVIQGFDNGSGKLPEFNIMYQDDTMPGDILTGSHLPGPDPMINEKKYGPFAAVKLSMNDKGYDCYLVDDQRAILVAKI
jgi:hypothetical protein